MILDPGKLTGWAVLLDGAMFASGEASFQDTGVIIQNFLNQRGECFIGWERFDITPHTYQQKGSQEAIEVTGMIRWLALQGGATLITPMSRQIKNQIPDGMLRATGWYRPGHGGHANDAARLMTVWLLSRHYLPGSIHGKILQYLKEESPRN
jgi:hypothetical protein